jgi:hypothetical protein
MMKLHEKCEERKAGIKTLLLELDEAREKASKELSKVNSLSRHLSVYQRKEMGFLRVNGGEGRKAAVSVQAKGRGAALLESAPAPVPAAGFASRRELKAWELRLLSVIGQLKKTLLQLELLELRCRELLVSIAKALEAFSYEFKTVKRKIYPFSIFSRLRRILRSFRGGAYYTPGDIRELAVLGALTVNVAEIAETPLF